MLVMRTTEHPAYPLGKLVGSKQPVGFYDLALAVYPLWLYGVEPRTLLRKQAAHDPHSLAALFDAAVVRNAPAPELAGDGAASVIPDEQEALFFSGFELLATPMKESD